MLLGDLSFLARLGVLIAVLAAICAWDFYRRGRQATRWREYLFLVTAGAVGAAVGVANDLITSSISPDYFLLGKGVPGGAGFQSRVIELGAHAGFFAAVVAVGIYLLANARRDGRRPLPLGGLARQVAKPLFCALAGGVVLGGVAAAWPLESALQSEVLRSLEPAARERFVTVWGVHIGLYVGLLLGAIWGVVSIQSKRSLQPQNGSHSVPHGADRRDARDGG